MFAKSTTKTKQNKVKNFTTYSKRIHIYVDLFPEKEEQWLKAQGATEKGNSPLWSVVCLLKDDLMLDFVLPNYLKGFHAFFA